MENKQCAIRKLSRIRDVRNSVGKSCRLEDDIKMELARKDCEGSDWTECIQKRIGAQVF